MIHQLRDETIHAFAVKTLQKHIHLGINGYRINDALVWDVLLKASSEYRSIYAICDELGACVHHNTLRIQLNARFDVSNLRTDEIAQNAVLAETIPQSIRG